MSEVRDLDDKIDSLLEDRARILRKLGWEESSSYPDCCWRWSKVFKGKTITESIDGAFALEVYLDDSGDEEESV